MRWTRETIRRAGVWSAGAAGCATLALAQGEERVRVEANPVAAPSAIVVRVVGREDGRPIAGFGVAVTPLYRGAGDSRQGVTDAEGVFRAERLRPGSCVVEIERGEIDRLQWSNSVVAVAREGAETLVKVRVELEGDIEGTVVDARGAPVPDATIASVSAWQRPWSVVGPFRARALAKADGAGRFRIERVGRGARICATAPGAAASECAFVVEPRRAHDEIELRLGGPGAAVRGHVVDERGEPIDDAFVFAQPQVEPRADGDADASVYSHLDEHGRERLDAPRAWFTRTARNGSFRIEHLERARYVVAALAPGFGPTGGAVDLGPGDARPLKLRLQRAVTVFGEIRDDEGKPVVGVSWVAVRRAPAGSTLGVDGPEPFDEGDPRARAFGARDGAMEQPRLPESPLRDGAWAVLPDRKGAFRIDDAPAGRIQVAVIGTDRGSVVRTFDAKAGETIRWDPVLPSRCTLRGRVVDARDEAVGEAWIVTDKKSGTRWTRARRDGRFELPLCPKRVMRVEVFERIDLRVARAGDDAPEMIAKYAEATVEMPREEDLVLRVGDDALASAWLRGPLKTFEGAPIGEASVELRWPIPPELLQNDTPDAARALLREMRAYSVGPRRGELDPRTGTFAIGPVRPGRYELWVIPEPETYLAFKAADVDLAAHETREWPAVRMPAFGELMLTESSGNAGNLEIEMKDASGARIPVDGPIVRRNPMPQRLLPGIYSLRAVDPRWTMDVSSFEVRAGEEARVMLTLRRN